MESINALAGIVLRKLRKVRRVVYYVSDYSPERYKPKWFNDLYLWLDRYAATHSDFIWDVSLAMMPARIKVGLDPQKATPVIHVPNALFPKQINYLPTSRIIPNSLVFVGTLGKINGPDLAIKALKIVLKSIPSTSLHIYGSGEPDMTRLKKLTEKLKLNNKVIFHGFISNQVKLSKETSMYAIGLAPYLAVPGSPRWWADATKIRLYLAAGVPVITTQVPPLGKEIERDEAGVIAKDNPQEQAEAVLKLLKDKKTYLKMRKNAIKRATDNTWENTYSQALKKMGL
ncbi:MAG: glycosyltransferase [Candidatus Blackburnbacteria bacterium]|nr:glycosyltransferase [Candidatus Blackburnbacteria bacterium]